MMQFTEKEKVAMLKAMDKLIKIDSEIDDREVEFLEAMVDEFDWDSKFLDKLDSYKEEDAIQAIRQISTEKLNYFQAMLCELANSDNNIHEEEINFIKYVNEYIMAHKA